MTTTTTKVDLSAVKTRQQQAWSSGDFAVIASRIVLVSELLADNADLHAGWRVLDVACGNGNATLAAARAGTTAVGIDYVPALIESGRDRAVTEGLDVEFQVADAEDLPFDNDSFDATLSVFGSMFAPDHQRVADEIVRVTRPGGRVALASWAPDGFIGQMFRVISSYVAPPAGVSSPLLWGTERHLTELFGNNIGEIHSAEQVCTFRYPSADEFVAFFRRWYGPTLKAFEAVGPDRETQLASDLAALAREFSVHDTDDVAVASTYLETVMTLRSSS